MECFQAGRRAHHSGRNQDGCYHECDTDDRWRDFAHSLLDDSAWTCPRLGTEFAGPACEDQGLSDDQREEREEGNQDADRPHSAYQRRNQHAPGYGYGQGQEQRPRQAPAPRRCLQDQEAEQNHDRGNGRHPKLAGLPLSGISQHLSVVLVGEGYPAQT
jgi:hypothetical protein